VYAWYAKNAKVGFELSLMHGSKIQFQHSFNNEELNLLAVNHQNLVMNITRFMIDLVDSSNARRLHDGKVFVQLRDGRHVSPPC
jgi:hypothetical protein